MRLALKMLCNFANLIPNKFAKSLVLLAKELFMNLTAFRVYILKKSLRAKIFYRRNRLAKMSPPNLIYKKPLPTTRCELARKCANKKLWLKRFMFISAPTHFLTSLNIALAMLLASLRQLIMLRKF